jgi:nucleotide-binding universal stress UspA family protein/mono/diheme cytochrome c family protein
MTPHIKRILVPLDFSSNSALALDYAYALAQKFDAALHLVHVCEVPSMMTGSMDAYAIAYTDWSQRLGEEAESELTRLLPALTRVKVSTEVLFGNPARAIVTAAGTNDADLIVMGTHGHGAVMHVVMGNVAERVVRTASCPVLTVREPRLKEREQPVVVHQAGAVAALILAAGLMLFPFAVPPAAAQDAVTPQPAMTQQVPGSELYRTYCATCHGTAARGDGPLASSMTRKPADLTEIAKRNGGLFPSELVFRTIDGKRPVRGHGGADMPVWGDAFARSRDGGDPATVKRMIDSLVDYLESIQLRPAHQ